MEYIKTTTAAGIATVTLSRGKVNALNDDVVDEIESCFKQLENDGTIKAIIFTGQGKFFSFGFDIPGFLGYTREEFTRYIQKFCSLYTYLFLYPKPIIAALNGHTVAGGCILATACDYRIMVTGKAKIALNEAAFGSTIFSGSIDMLKVCAGQRNAELIAGTGRMFSAEEAREMGLVDKVADDDTLMKLSLEVAQDYASRYGPAYKSIKHLLRRPVADAFILREEESIKEFIDIWYSDETWKNLQQIEIHQ